MGSEKECPPREEEKSFPRAGEKAAQNLPFPMNENALAVKETALPAQGFRPYRFGKNAKIKRNREINAVLKGGKRYACPYFKICYLGNGLNRSRYAFITPKTMGSAVSRNGARRIMRELLRRGPSRGLHLDILFRLNEFTGATETDTLEGALEQWYESLKK